MKPDRVIWLDRGWQPVFFGFCPNEKAWKREVKRLGCKGLPYPESDGCCTYFTKDGKASALVTMNAREGRTRVQIAGLLAHEATHVWQEVRRQIGEKEPSIEFEAYSVQAIFQGLYQAWLDTRAPKEMLATGAVRK